MDSTSVLSSLLPSALPSFPALRCCAVSHSSLHAFLYLSRSPPFSLPPSFSLFHRPPPLPPLPSPQGLSSSSSSRSSSTTTTNNNNNSTNSSSSRRSSRSHTVRGTEVGLPLKPKVVVVGDMEGTQTQEGEGWREHW